MANQEIPFSKQPSDPSLKDLLDLHKKDIFLSLNCCKIGKIQSFDSEKQTATIVINSKKTVFRKNPDDSYSAKYIDYPVLTDCPVVVLKGGGVSLRMPIAEGDSCLLLFNDRDIDNWYASGQKLPNASPRMHSISDGFALVGIQSLAESLGGYEDGKAILGDNQTSFKIGGGKVTIENDTKNLYTILNTLITTIQAITVAATPIDNAAAFTPIATDLGSLLE